MRDDGNNLEHEVQTLQSENDQRRAIDTIELSLALQAVVARHYLDLPLGEIMRPLPEEGARRTEVAAFLRLAQVGKPLADSAWDALTALQNVLTACHAPGCFTLIFLLASDGAQNSLYLGAQSHNNRLSANGFLRSIAHFYEANWPGTEFVSVDANDEAFARMVRKPLQEDGSGYAVALTGVPSLKSGEARGYPQTLDRLLNGMRGKSFLYMVIAEPIGIGEIDDILVQCRNLISQVHVLAKSALTITSGTQATYSEGESLGESVGKALSESFGSARSQQDSSYFKEELKRFFLWGKPSEQSSETNSTTETETHGKTTTFSQSLARSASTGRNIGREHVNTHAQAVEVHLEQYVKRFEQSRALGSWNVGVYFFAEREDLVRQGGMQIKALLTGEKSNYEPIRIHDIYRFWRDVNTPLSTFRQPSLGIIRSGARERGVTSLSDRIEHLLGHHFSGLTTPLNTEELALLTNLPQREINGIPIIATAAFGLNVPVPTGNDLVLGPLIEGARPTASPYPVSPETLVKHTLITGITGSGKSTTCLRILAELQKRSIPFLVIEPAKDEYVAWAMERNRNLATDDPNRIAVYMPGVHTWHGTSLTETLRLNPFDIVWLDEEIEPQVLGHIDRLRSILTAAFPMQEVLPVLLEELIYHVYYQPATNWLAIARPRFGSYCPTISQILCHVSRVIAAKGYEERVTANLTAALKTRLQSLRRGWKRTLFDSPRSTPWMQLFGRPVVINLSQLGDDSDKCLAMSLILQFLYEYRQAEHNTHSGDGSVRLPLRHVTVVEEAHRVMLKPTNTGIEQANTQAKTAEAFVNMLSEVRAYGEGFIIADQVPGRLIPDAIKNTNLKIVHRLIARDDCEAMAGCMSMTVEQMAMMSRLRPGQAIVSGEQDDTPCWVQVTR